MLNPHARFDSFVVGTSNRLAATAAKAVAESPGSAYNPLFFYARPGLGKTHLLSAIGHEARSIDPSRLVEYITVDDFVEAYHAALGAGQADAYRRRFTGADLVLVDDAQLLADQRELQSELLRLIDVLMAGDRQIVLASDRPPEEIQSLDERLIRRFAGGLVIDIGAPDYETRLAILSRRATERHASFSPEVLAAVADAPIATVRELLGALNRLLAQQAVAASPVTVEQARRLLAGLGHARSAQSPPAVSVAAATPMDEFGAFLNDVSAAVSQQVDRWRQSVTQAALRYQAEGFHTARLDSVLAGDMANDPEVMLREFEGDVDQLRGLQQEAAVVAPELLSDTILYDPDRVRDAVQLMEEARESGGPLPGPSPRYTAETFAEGDRTQPVMESVRSAAASPGQNFNPLVIVGRSGVGKTHLLHAFGHALKSRGLNRVAVLDAKEYVDTLVAALAEDNVVRWRQRLRRVDALLIDNIDLLAGKDRSQDELYLVYNLLLESGRQMAFTSSVPPAQLQGIEPRLATRMAGGLVLELGPPDREARIAEILRLLGQDHVHPDLADYLASRQASTLRDVQQLVQRLTQAAEERRTPLTLEVARDILEGSTDAFTLAQRRHHGILAPGTGAVRSREKMIETWPDVAERMIEEWA